MEYTISFLSELQIVVIQTHGVADESSSREMVKNISGTMMQYNVMRLLIDHSALDAVSGDVLTMYYRPKELRETGIPSKVKIAEVVLPEHKAHFGFLETVFRNRGFDFSVFYDRESAIQWLTK